MLADMEKAKKTTLTYVVIAGIMTAALFVWSFLLCSADCTAYDDSYQYFLNLHSWSEMFELIKLDYSPPLYSIVLKLYSEVFGTSLASLRICSVLLLSTLFGLALFPLRRLMGRKCALLAAFLFFASGYNYFFGVTTRPTVMAYVLTTGMFIYSMLAFFGDKKSDMVKFTVLSLLCMYTHNVSLIAAFCIYGTSVIASLILKKKDICVKFLISGVIVSILYIPWLIVLLGQTGNAIDHFWSNSGTWLYAIFIVFVGMVMNYSNLSFTIPSVIFIAFLPLINYFLLMEKGRFKEAHKLSELVSIKQMKEGWTNLSKLLYLAITLGLSVTGFFLVTRFVLPIFANRYFYILSGAGIIFVSCLATLCKGKKAPALILAVLMTVTFFMNAFSELNIVRNSKRDELIKDVSAMAGDQPVFIDFHEHSLGVAGYYFPDSKHFVTQDTFMVLQSYEVFDLDYTCLGKADEIWDYTDTCYIFSSFDFESGNIDPIEYYLYYFDDKESVRIEYMGDYPLPYTNEIGYGIYRVEIYKVSHIPS